MGNNCGCSNIDRGVPLSITEQNELFRCKNDDLLDIETKLKNTENKDKLLRNLKKTNKKKNNNNKNKNKHNNNENENENEYENKNVNDIINNINDNINEYKNFNEKKKKCILNVKSILKYIEEHEKYFLLNFKKNNAKKLNHLKHMVINYDQYIIYLDINLIYIGQQNKKNQKNGIGIIITSDQCIYIGEFKKDKIKGFGLYITCSKSKYIGYWINGKANKYGMFLHKNGTFYKGFWLNDKQHKIGIEYVKKKYIYIGYYYKGKKNGFGLYIWKNNCMYIGNIKNDYFNDGIYFINKNKIYIGNWKNSCIFGFTEIFWINKKQFFGYHKNNFKNGLGIYKWNDGRIYIGNWINNKQDGYGIFIIIKNFHEYEKKNDFLLNFKKTENIKKNILLNIMNKFNFSSKIVNQMWNRFNINHFYYILNNICNLDYYNIYYKYIKYISKNKNNYFRFNKTFYRKDIYYLYRVTKRYFNDADFIKLFNEINNKNIEYKQNIIEEKEKENIIKEKEKENIIEEKEKENIIEEKKKENIIEEKEKENIIEEKENIIENYFKDIDMLLKYLNSLDYNKFKILDINTLNPIFNLTSKNIIIKLGMWEKGKLKKWIYSSQHFKNYNNYEQSGKNNYNNYEQSGKNNYNNYEQSGKNNYNNYEQSGKNNYNNYEQSGKNNYNNIKSYLNNFSCNDTINLIKEMNHNDNNIFYKNVFKNYNEYDVEDFNKKNDKIYNSENNIKSDENYESDEYSSTSSLSEFTMDSRSNLITLHEQALIHHRNGTYSNENNKIKKKNKKNINEKNKKNNSTNSSAIMDSNTLINFTPLKHRNKSIHFNEIDKYRNSINEYDYYDDNNNNDNNNNINNNIKLKKNIKIKLDYEKMISNSYNTDNEMYENQSRNMLSNLTNKTESKKDEKNFKTILINKTDNGNKIIKKKNTTNSVSISEHTKDVHYYSEFESSNENNSNPLNNFISKVWTKTKKKQSDTNYNTKSNDEKKKKKFFKKFTKQNKKNI